MPRRLHQAVLAAFLCHGSLVLTGRYHSSFDAYTHMLFADHYARSWWSLWETRWYTGFEVVSYPPLAHQLIALLTPLLGVDAAFAAVLWAVASAYPLGIYVFSRIFTGRTAASHAALCSALLIPIFITAHIFGQLPHLTATLFALFGSAALARFLREGGAHNLALAVALTATTMAAHHATLLFQPFLILAVTARLLFDHVRPGTVLARLALFGGLAIPAALLVIWPFWAWGAQQTMQTPIDHLSRHNFLTDPFAQVIFFWPMYGPLAALIPVVLFRRWPRRFWGLIFCFSLLFVLGLGGTTPLPSWLFGRGWQWLTYDRFAFWASLTLTPFFGTAFILGRRRLRPRLAGFARARLSTLTYFIFGITALGAGFAPAFFPIQPKAIDMRPILEFLNEDFRSAWRYLTFGFGDQFAYLNLLTSATTIDGSYHTARSLPELRESGIAQIDTAFWSIKGVAGIDPILQKAGQHGVRWGFVGRTEYVPELRKNGWRYLGTLSDGIQVWENPQAVVPEPSKPPPTSPLAEISWGTLPLFALLSTAALGGLRLWPIQAEAALRGVHAFLVGLLPAGLCFWYYRTAAPFDHPRVYFPYSQALFFLADALALLAVMIWLAVRLAGSEANSTLPLSPSPGREKNGSLEGRTGTNAFHRVWRMTLAHWLLALCLLASLSILWAVDWRTSLYFSMHLWLVFGLFLSLRDWPQAWNAVLLGCCAALALEVLAGFVESGTQSTHMLAALRMQWPGPLDPSVRGASIVQLANGGAWLRAYGTLPHPNILGGFVLLFLLGPVGLAMRRPIVGFLPFLLFGAGAALLALTFSRSAWLGLAAGALVLAWKSAYLDRKRLLALGLAAMLASVLALVPLRQAVQARFSSSPTPAEEFSSVARAWLTQQALQLVRERPLTGVGIGGFVIELGRRAGVGYIVEPVHSLPLLAAAELGIPGLLLMAGLAFTIAPQLVRTQRPETILAGAVLVGLGVTGLFDHYLWTLAPGRVLFGLMLGLWAGQVKQDGP